MSEYVHQISDEESEQIQRFMYVAAISIVAFVVLVIVALVTIDRWILVISPASERQFIEPYVTWAHEYVLEPADPALQEYVDGLAERIAAQMNVEA